jgi:hypothetical protein
MRSRHPQVFVILSVFSLPYNIGTPYYIHRLVLRKHVSQACFARPWPIAHGLLNFINLHKLFVAIATQALFTNLFLSSTSNIHFKPLGAYSNTWWDQNTKKQNVNCLKYCMWCYINKYFSGNLSAMFSKWARIVCLYHGENKLHSMRWIAPSTFSNVY